MNFKKPKEHVIADAQIAAENILASAFNNLKYGYRSNSIDSTLDQIQYAVSTAIASSIRSLVENTYTDQEFEEDIGLKDKK
jgi:hypothetical protein